MFIKWHVNNSTRKQQKCASHICIMATQMVNDPGLIAMQIKCWVLPVAPGGAVQLLHGQQCLSCISHSTNASVTAQMHQSQHKRISHSTNAMQVACNTGAAASVTVAGMLTIALAVHLQHGKQAVGPCVSHSTNCCTT